MSMDFPDYQKIKQKNRWYACIWIFGDRVYYIGLLGAMCIIIEAPVDAFFTWLKGSQVGLPMFNFGGFTALTLCLFCFYIGIPLKTYARKSAGVKSCLQGMNK